MSRDTGYGESKRALAANTSCACCFGAFSFFRASALAIHLVVAAFRATKNRGPICDRTDDLSDPQDRSRCRGLTVPDPDPPLRRTRGTIDRSIAKRGRLDERRS